MVRGHSQIKLIILVLLPNFENCEPHKNQKSEVCNVFVTKLQIKKLKYCFQF